MSRQILSSVLWSLCRTWGGRIAGFIIYFQLARLLTPLEMGLFSAAFAVLMLGDILVDQGTVQAVVQRPQVTPAMLTASLLLNFLFAGSIVILLWASAPAIEALLAVPGLAPVLRVGSIALLVTSLGYCQEAMARREFRFRTLALRTLVSTIVGGAVGVVLALRGHGVWALVVQMLVSACINSAALWLRPAWKPLVRPDFAGTASTIKFGVQVTGFRLVEFGGTRGVELLVAAGLGASALGFYAVGTKIHYIFLQLLGMALVDVAQSGFARLAADLSRLRSAYLSAVGSVAMLSTPVWIVLSACAPEVCDIAFGQKWADSADVLAAFAVLGAMQVIQNFDVAALNAIGRPALSVVLIGCRTLAALGAVLLFQGFGLQAVVLAYASSQLLLAPLNLWLLRRALGLRPGDWLRRVWPAVAGATAAWLAMTYYRSQGGIGDWPAAGRLLVLAVLGGGTYLSTVALLARERLNELLTDAMRLKQS